MNRDGLDDPPALEGATASSTGPNPVETPDAGGPQAQGASRPEPSVETPSRRRSGSNALARALRLAQKELREILRDRRTIITLVLMPILVYPLIGTVFQKILLERYAVQQEGPTYRVAVDDSTQLKEVIQLLRIGEENPMVADTESGSGSDASGVPKTASTRDGEATEPPDPQAVLEDPREPTFEFFERPPGVSLQELVASGRVDLGVRVLLDLEAVPLTDEAQPRRVEVVSQEGATYSQSARDFLLDRLVGVNIRVLQGLSGNESLPFRADVIELPATSTAQGTLATLVPLILILMTVTGAVYPAIDLTAGERERGTLETLIAAPLPRLGLLGAKYLAVLSVAVLTAVVNLVSMTITGIAIGLQPEALGLPALSLPTVALVFGLVVLFAGFFSAVLLSLTSFARSFKEAQAYLIPLMLLALAPGFFSLVPDVTLESGLALVPLVNIVLLARDLLQGGVAPVSALAAVISTLLYAGLALSLAARIFGTDAILYGSQGTWSDLLRRPVDSKSDFTPTHAMLGLALAFPGFLWLSGIPGRFEALPLAARLGLSSLVTTTLFVGIPWAIAWWNRIRLPGGLGMRPSAISAFVAAVLLGGSLWAFVYEAIQYTVDEGRLEFLRKLGAPILDQIQQIPLAVRLLFLAVIPATVEELFFRGMVLGGLAQKLKARWAVPASAVAFGLFHVFVRDALMFERFLPSTLMGLVLGMVYLRTRSVWPGILLHVLHNGLLLTLSNYQETLLDLGIGTESVRHLPIPWLAGFGVTALLGFGILLLLVPKPKPIAVDSVIEDPEAKSDPA